MLLSSVILHFVHYDILNITVVVAKNNLILSCSHFKYCAKTMFPKLCTAHSIILYYIHCARMCVRNVTMKVKKFVSKQYVTANN